MTLADFIAEVVAHPGAEFYREMFADWLDEHGLPGQAEGQRWASRHGKRPSPIAGWWFGGTYPESNELPRLFFKNNLDCDPLHAFGEGASKDEMRRGHEHNFLARCAELAWGPDGEPVGRRKGVTAS